MTYNVPVEESPSRRRASTVESIGLDYSSSRMDEDIKTRVRSLLLSRNNRCPPRTPFSSDEHAHRYSESCTTVSAFDFGTTKSVAGTAQKDTRHPSLAGIKRALSKSAHSDMEARRETKTSIPSVVFSMPPSRNSLSAEDLRAMIDGPTSPTPKRKRFKLPKLVLQDKKQPDIEVKSCIEISSSRPEDDAKVHEEELDCCPPCDPRDSKPSKYIVNHPTQAGPAIKVAPGDLACFLAGCPPSQSNCAKHQRRTSSPGSRQSGHGRYLGEDLKRVTDGLLHDAAKLGYVLKSVPAQFATTLPPAVNSNSIVEAQSLPESKILPPSGLRTPPLLSETSSVTSGSFDAFPHAVQSLEKALKEELPPTFSTSINTNFSLAGVRAKQRGPRIDAPKHKISEAPNKEQSEPTKSPLQVEFDLSLGIDDDSLTAPVRNKQSAASLKSNGKSPSLLSGTSKKSARHALLKPVISEDQSIDTGLPVPPVLSTIISTPESPIKSGADEVKDKVLKVEKNFLDGNKSNPSDNGERQVQNNDEGSNVQKYPESKDILGDVADTFPSPMVENVTKLQKATGFGDCVRDQRADTQEVKANTTAQSARSKSPPYEPSKSRLGSPKGHALAECQSPAGLETLSPAPPATQKIPISNTPNPILSKFGEPVGSETSADSLNAAYWGFVPAVRDAVHDAVQKAVKNAVHEVVIPPGTEKDVASEAYRKLVADSLNKAAKKADDYLRSASLWNIPPSSRRESEATVLVRSKPTKYDVDWWKKDPCQLSKEISPITSPIARGSVSSKDQENAPQLPSNTAGNDSNTRQYGDVSSVPVAFDAQQNIMLSPTRIIEEELEAVSLEPDEKFDDKQGWKPWKKGPPAGYSAIPNRQSSKNRVLSPKSATTNSSTKVSSKNKPTRKRSFDRIQPQSSRILRSISSFSSLRSAIEGAALIPEQKEKSIGHNNTVHWLKDLLSSKGPYEPRFTALPPRTRNGQDPLSPIRSNTAPVQPVAELFLGVTPQPLEMPKKAVIPTVSKLNRIKRVDISETFTQTINDLETLMSEAITIARQAADSQDPTFVPAMLGNATKVLKDGRKAEAIRFDRETLESRLLGTRNSDEVSSIASIHESLKSFYDSDDSYQSDPPQPQARTISMSIKDKAKISSGWPPTSRVSATYPPASLPPSNKDNDETINRIKPVDPRSMPTETDLEFPRKKSTQESTTNSANGETTIPRSTPRFRNIEPFQRAPTGEKRKSSGKSPRHLSVVRKSQIIPEDPYDSPPEPAEIPLDLCGQPVGHSLPRPGRGISAVRNCIKGHSEDDHQAISTRLTEKSVPNRREVRDYIVETHRPLIPPRDSSRNLRKQAAQQAQEAERFKVTSQKTDLTTITGQTYNWQDVDFTKIEPCPQQETQELPTARLNQVQIDHNRGGTHSLDGSMMTRSEELDFNHGYGVRHRGGGEPNGSKAAIELRDSPDPNLPVLNKIIKVDRKHFSLTGKRHVSLKDHHLKGFSLSKTHKQQKIARDWSPGRKRFVATVACFSTALVGIIVGIYAGETPAIQYYIVDFHHYTVLGNVFFFIGLSIPTFLFWPLPLLHGRKPYILGSMSLAMPLLFPQALAVGSFRSPYVSTYRVGLLMSRALMGFCLGFANMNFKGMLTDLFGASLQSTHPHQEHVDEFDVRRHGGGMGIWLGLWTWSALGSIGLGFLIGACIVNTLPPAWGFYVSIIIIAFVMLLNVLCPEVRRSAFRRSVAEVVKENAVSRRLARGEVKMHMVQSGPKWWGEEFHYGVMLSQKMIRQPGFMIMAFYVAWIYGQQVLIIVLLGALMSKDYKFKSPMVGLSVMAIPLGALVAIPFQKAGLFSRSREHAPVSDDGTFRKKVQLSSHMVRRTIFVLCLPIAGLCYTLSAAGPPTPFIVPILLAGLIGFLSNLAMAECHGIIMETFDTSDLQPGMTGRPRGSSGDKTASKRTNYSSFPRIMSAFGITQGIGYLFAAASSGVGGVLTRHLGQQAATGVMAGILLILSILLLLSLVRFTEVQIIPNSRKDEMDRYHNARRASQMRRDEGIEEEEPWRPIIIGNPHHSTRRMHLLELGSLSRFSEIRIKNHLVDEAHLNRAAINTLEAVIKEKEAEIVANVRRSLSRHSSKGSRKSRYSDRGIPEQGDLGGHREMLKSGNGSRGRGRNATPGGSRKERRISE